MTTAAQPPFNLEVTNTDAMDLLTESGYNVVDQDVDFDIGSANGDRIQEDDALSLQDAATDGGTQDDYMVDKDDLIEEDEIDYDDLELEDAAQNLASHTGNDPASMNEASVEVEIIQEAPLLEQPVEDLFDYSDMDGDTADQTAAAAQFPPTTVHYDPGGSHPTLADGQSLAPSIWEEPLRAGDHGNSPNVDEQQLTENDEQHTKEASAAGAGTLATTLGDNDEDERQPIEHSDQQQYQVEAESKDESLDQEVNEQAASITPHDQMTHNSTEHLSPAIAEQQKQDLEQDEPLHPVTINYEGSELWLFKPHNEEEEGEWLLSDESLATQQFPYLFHACRAQLGDDLDNDTELGLRFDNFHGLELYEDCTACAYTTLKELLDCYLKLHAQDGNTDPESFYVSMQFRPRVLTLVNEIKKAADDQIGFSGFNTAVASGKSGFSPALSDVNTGAYHENWDEEHQDQGEHENEDEEAKDEEGVTHVEDSEQQPTQTTPHAESQIEHKDSPKSSVDDGPQEVNDVAEGKEVSRATTGSASGSDHEEDEPAEDLIDYSDEEDGGDDVQTEQASVSASSSASSTVQGDELSQTQNGAVNDTNTTENYDDTQSVNDHEASVHNDEETLEEVHPQLHGDDAYDADEIVPPEDQAFDEAFGQAFDAPDEGYDFEQYSALDQHDLVEGDIHEAGGLEAALTHDLEGQDDVEATLNDTVDDAFTGTDDFLDLTGGNDDYSAEDPSGSLNEAVEDEIGYDDEGDETQPASTATSAAVPPAVTSTTGGKDQSSPLVQKRPIDEVDFSLEGTSEEADAKRTKL